MRKALLIGSTSFRRSATRSDAIAPSLSARVCGYVPKQASRVAFFSAVHVAIMAYLVAPIDLMIWLRTAPVTSLSLASTWIEGWIEDDMNWKWIRVQQAGKWQRVKPGSR